MHEKKATMLGYSMQEFPTNVYEICKLIHPDDYESTMEHMRDHLQGKSPVYDVVYRIKAKNNAYKYYYDRGGIVERDIQGKPLKLIGLVVDVTKIQQLEHQVSKTKKNKKTDQG
jgi:two-component system CheB/CheR fusion protein